MTTNVIQIAECVDAMRSLLPGSIDLVFADPPFNIGYKYDAYHDLLPATEYLRWSILWMSQVKRVLKPTGTFWLAIGDDYAADLKIVARDRGFHCRSWCIWYYTFGVNCENKFSRSHTHLFQFVVNPSVFTFNAAAIRVPSARQAIYRDKRANIGGRLPDDTWILRPQELEMNELDSVWHVPRVAGTFKEREGFHGCQMPELILDRIIKVSSNFDDVVLDPFSGSAVTSVVAKKLGRNSIAFDISEEYVAKGLERLSKVSANDCTLKMIQARLNK